MATVVSDIEGSHRREEWRAVNSAVAGGCGKESLHSHGVNDKAQFSGLSMCSNVLPPLTPYTMPRVKQCHLFLRFLSL